MGNGFGGFGPSQGFGNPGGLSGGRIASNLLTVAQAPFLFGQGGIGIGEAGPLPIPGLGGARDLISFVTSLFDDGGDGAELPRQARHSKHPAYGRVIGVSGGLIVTQESKVYPTIDDAVRAARSAAVNRARATGREAYGFIYTSNGGFTYSGPFDTERESGGRIPVELDSAAMYHTHRWSALLSSDDIDYMNVRSRKPVYVLTVPPLGEPPESGGIVKFMPGHEGEPFMLP